jgi:hypothetical protein
LGFDDRPEITRKWLPLEVAAAVFELAMMAMVMMTAMMPMRGAVDTVPVRAVIVPVVVAMGMRTHRHTAPIDVGGDAVGNLPRSGCGSGIGQRHRLRGLRWRCDKQQPRNREKAKNLFHECPLLMGSNHPPLIRNVGSRRGSSPHGRQYAEAMCGNVNAE